MRKLLLAIAMVPTMSHAALVIEEGPSRPTPTEPSIKAVPASTRATPSRSVHATTVAAKATTSAAATQLIAPEAPASPAEPIAVAPVWAINPADGTLQRLFTRWAKTAGWQSLWELDQDIPLVATAQFNGNFTDAVQQVLRTTESTDTPAHPCFYTNNVMRVVPIATVCDPDNE